MSMLTKIDEAINAKNQETLKTYYASVEKGEFLKILGTLSEDIEYVISGDPNLLPFAGVWSGKSRVTELFKAFGGAFQLLELKENIVIQSADRNISCNDESFMVWKSGRYYRVPVLHIAEFNSDNLIKRFINIHDTSAAEQAFRSENPSLIPIMSVKVAQQRLNLSESMVQSIARDLISVIFDGKNVTNYENLLGLRLFVPGLPTRDYVSGVWTAAGLEKYYPDRLKLFRERLKQSNFSVKIDTITADKNNIAIEGRVEGKPLPWAIIAQLDNGGVDAATLFFDFPAIQ